LILSQLRWLALSAWRRALVNVADADSCSDNRLIGFAQLRIIANQLVDFTLGIGAINDAASASKAGDASKTKNT
jgi:hypothetical protein